MTEGPFEWMRLVRAGDTNLRFGDVARALDGLRRWPTVRTERAWRRYRPEWRPRKPRTRSSRRSS